MKSHRAILTFIGIAFGIAVSISTTVVSVAQAPPPSGAQPRGPGGPGAGGPGTRGPGGPGRGFVRPRPGQILPGFLQDRLKLSDAQKKKLTALQKDVDSKLAKILTADQNKQLKDMQTRGPGRGGPGAPGGPGGRGPGDTGGGAGRGPGGPI